MHGQGHLLGDGLFAVLQGAEFYLMVSYTLVFL